MYHYAMLLRGSRIETSTTACDVDAECEQHVRRGLVWTILVRSDQAMLVCWPTVESPSLATIKASSPRGGVIGWLLVSAKDIRCVGKGWGLSGQRKWKSGQRRGGSPGASGLIQY